MAARPKYIIGCLGVGELPGGAVELGLGDTLRAWQEQAAGQHGAEYVDGEHRHLDGESVRVTGQDQAWRLGFIAWVFRKLRCYAY